MSAVEPHVLFLKIDCMDHIMHGDQSTMDYCVLSSRLSSPLAR